MIESSRRAFFERGRYPLTTDINVKHVGDFKQQMGAPVVVPEMEFTAAHGAFTLYLTRILKPIWKNNITTKM